MKMKTMLQENKFRGCGGCNFADRKELWVVIPVASQRFTAWVPASKLCRAYRCRIRKNRAGK